MKNMKNIYRIKQAELREEAISWQMDEAQESYSMGELAEWFEYFETEGRKWGLLREFRNEGIL